MTDKPDTSTKVDMRVPEYPKGWAFIEMTLVRLMHHRRSWADYLQIATALSNVVFHADSMRKERDMFVGNGEATPDD